MVVVTTIKLPVSCLGGRRLLSTSIRRKVSQQESSSKTERTPKDASKSSRKTPVERKSSQSTIMLMKLTNSIVSTVVTNSTKNLRIHGPLITFLSLMTLKRLNQGLLLHLVEELAMELLIMVYLIIHIHVYFKQYLHFVFWKFVENKKIVNLQKTKKWLFYKNLKL